MSDFSKIIAMCNKLCQYVFMVLQYVPYTLVVINTNKYNKIVWRYVNVVFSSESSDCFSLSGLIDQNCTHFEFALWSLCHLVLYNNFQRN